MKIQITLKKAGGSYNVCLRVGAKKKPTCFKNVDTNKWAAVEEAIRFYRLKNR